MKDIRIIVFVFLFVNSMPSFAQPQIDRTALLKEQIENSKSIDSLYSNFEELLDLYGKNNKFDEFYIFLEGLNDRKIFKDAPLIYYYKALARFGQMKFQEENKMWQELFDHKEEYEKDLTESLAKVGELSPQVNPWTLRSKLLEYRLKKDKEQDSFEVLEELFKISQEYVKTNFEIDVLRDTADALFAEEEVNYAKKLYNVYVSKISKKDLSQQELKNLAESFLKEDKTDLAVSLYDVYLEKLIESKLDKKIIINEILGIANKFIHTGYNEGKDPFYAKKVYEKLESLYKNEAFDAIAQYKRAYNLERTKEYDSCFKEYLKLVSYPDYPDKDRIYFRSGILSAYIFARIDQANGFFLKVTNEFKQSKDYLNSLYHLGLLNHEQLNLEKAKEFYNIILENTKELKEKPEIALLAKYRLEEIEGNRAIEYNLRTFLDAALNKEKKQEYVKLELFAKMPKGYLTRTVKFEANSYLSDTGCLQQNFSYLWSGELGTNQNPINEYEFDTSYRDLGTKVVNVVLVDPTGVVNYAIEIADIYNEK